MAANLLSYEVSDLCLGKPPLRSLSISSTVAEALLALKTSQENYLSVWNCNHSTSSNKEFNDCNCIGKICMVDIVCYLCNEENISSPSSALNSSVSVLLSKIGLVQHVDSHLSLLDAVNLMLKGAQNLVVPIQSNITQNSRKKLHHKSSSSPNLHNGYEFCWLTQEDVVRFLLNSIGLFSPMVAYSIESLCIISADVLAIGYHESVCSAIPTISTALLEQTSVAVLDDEGKLIGEISPFALASCDETVTAAITTLSTGDLMAYIDHGYPSEDIVRVMKARLKEKNLLGMLKLLDDSSNYSASSSSSSSSSSDDESCSSSNSTLSTPYRRSGSYSARMVRSAKAIVCQPGSSLVAVMMQAIVHRVNYVWVIQDDYSLVGIVTFSEILKVFHGHLESIA